MPGVRLRDSECIIINVPLTWLRKKTVNTRKMSAINIDKGIPYELNKGGRHFADTVKTLARSYRLNNKGEGNLGT